MRRNLLLALAGLAVTGTGCMSTAAPGAAPPVVHHVNVAKAAHAARSKPVDPRAALIAAAARTVASGSAQLTETVQLVGARSKAGVPQDAPLLLAGDLDFAGNRAHLDEYTAPFTEPADVLRVVVAKGVRYAGSVTDGSLPAVGSGTVNPAGVLGVPGDVQGRVVDDGLRHFAGVGQAHEYTYRVVASRALAIPLAMPSSLLEALAQRPAREDAYVDANGRIVALVDHVDVAGAAVPGVPSTVTTVQVVRVLSGFGLGIYQHVSAAGAVSAG